MEEESTCSSQDIKVLIVSAYNFNGCDATSITLRNLFSSWKRENIAFVYINENAQYQVKSDNCFSISKKIFFNLRSQKEENEIIKTLRNSRSKIDGVTGVIKSESIKARILNLLHTYISAYKSILPYKYTKELNSFIEGFKPDYIYSPLGSIGIMKLSLKISKKFRTLIVPHFMDDWVNVMFKGRVLLIIPRLSLLWHLKRIKKQMPFGLAISKFMADEYTHKCNKQFFSFMNCVEILIPEEANNKPINDQKFRFCYAGGLHLGRVDSLLIFCNALKKVNENLEVELSIYTSSQDWYKFGDPFKEFKFVKYEGFVNEREIGKVFVTKDCLVHVESFDSRLKAYTRLSISTKIPDYLSSGKPVLSIGPPDIASIKYLRECNVGLVLDNKVSVSEEDIENFIMDKELLNLYSKNSFEASKNHCLFSQSNKLKELFMRNLPYGKTNRLN